MTVTPKNDSFTYFSARGDADIVRPADVVAVANPDGTPLSKSLGSATDIASQIELMRSIDAKLGALLILMTNAFSPGDQPESYLDAAEKGLRSN